MKSLFLVLFLALIQGCASTTPKPLPLSEIFSLAQKYFAFADGSLKEVSCDVAANGVNFVAFMGLDPKALPFYKSRRAKILFFPRSRGERIEIKSSPIREQAVPKRLKEKLKKLYEAEDAALDMIAKTLNMFYLHGPIEDHSWLDAGHSFISEGKNVTARIKKSDYSLEIQSKEPVFSYSVKFNEISGKLLPSEISGTPGAGQPVEIWLKYQISDVGTPIPSDAGTSLKLIFKFENCQRI